MTPQQIKKIISKHHKTQREIAEKMGMTPQTLQERINAGSISADTIERIAHAIGISPAEFYDEDIYTSLREENARLRMLVQEQMKTIKALMK